MLKAIHLKRKLLDLRAYHFSDVLNIWNLKDGTINYELAREATGELLNALMGRYGDYEQIVANIQKRHFCEEQILYGANLSGMLQRVYDSTQSKAVIDYLQNHPNKEVSSHFKDLREYHFGYTKHSTWTTKGRKKYELARQATGELLDVLKERNGWDYEQVVQNIQQKHFISEAIRHGGATLGGMLANVYDDSPSKAVIDFLKNHTDAKIRRQFKHLREYHFGKAQNNLWVRKDGTKNYELARQAIGELVATLRARWGWDDQQIRRNLCRKNFLRIPIRHNSTLGGMLEYVYEGSVRAAVRDYFMHQRAS